MRKIILLLSFVLVSAFPAFSQTVYSVCQTKQDINIYNLMQDTYNVTSITGDSFNFTANNQNYTVKKAPNANFYYYETNDEVHQNDFFVYPVDDKSFFVVPYDTISQSNFLEMRYYHVDRKLAAVEDVNKRCAWETFPKAREIMTAWLNQKKAADGKAYWERSKIIYTDFAKNYQSKRNDPVLNKEIIKWWRDTNDDASLTPILRINIINQDWGFLRNQYGIVTGKSIDAMIIFKRTKDNQCFAGWRSYQYEALGGGTFDTVLKHWFRTINSGLEYDFFSLPENRRMQTGQWNEVDCAAFPSAPLR